jgi:hypothetical protein
MYKTLKSELEEYGDVVKFDDELKTAAKMVEEYK